MIVGVVVIVGKGGIVAGANAAPRPLSLLPSLSCVHPPPPVRNRPPAYLADSYIYLFCCAIVGEAATNSCAALPMVAAVTVAHHILAPPGRHRSPQPPQHSDHAIVVVVVPFDSATAIAAPSFLAANKRIVQDIGNNPCWAYDIPAQWGGQGWQRNDDNM
jgi:hypothetical protein